MATLGQINDTITEDAMTDTHRTLARKGPEHDVCSAAGRFQGQPRFVGDLCIWRCCGDPQRDLRARVTRDGSVGGCGPVESIPVLIARYGAPHSRG